MTRFLSLVQPTLDARISAAMLGVLHPHGGCLNPSAGVYRIQQQVRSNFLLSLQQTSG